MLSCNSACTLDTFSWPPLYLNVELTKHLVSDVQTTNVEVKVGTPCTLSCTVSGITSPVTITWRRYTQGQAVEINVDLADGKQTKKLRLLESEVTMDKDYVCSISSTQSGPQETYAYLYVYGKISTTFLSIRIMPLSLRKSYISNHPLLVELT